MENVWARLEAWLDEHLPDGLHSLRPGVSLADLERTEAHLGAPLPGDVRASYLRHDGQDDAGPELTPHGRLLPLGEVVDTWALWTELLRGGDFEGNAVEADEEVQPVWWHPGWIPVTSNGAGDALCVDTAPTSRGTGGQVIEVWHADPDRPLENSSFRQYLTDLAGGLERGVIAYDPEMHRLCED